MTRLLRASLLSLALVAMSACSIGDITPTEALQDDVPDGTVTPGDPDDPDLERLPDDEIPIDVDLPAPEPGVLAPAVPCDSPLYVKSSVRLVSGATELRAGPSVTDKVVAVLPTDAWLVVEESGCGPFVKVIDDQKRAGWVLDSKTRTSPCTTPKYPRGAVLYATGALSLRAEPIMTAAAIASDAANAKMIVAQNACTGTWVRVTDPASKTGYVETSRLTSTAPPPPTPPSPTADYSATRGSKLAAKALAMWSGHSSGGLCLKGVRMSAESSGIIPTPPGWTRFGSAYEWGVWANANPTNLKKIGFRRVIGLGVNKIPRGSVIVWKKGQCGYHSLYGHIEIVTDTASSKTCSDYCGSVKKTCGEPWTYIPTVL